MAKTKKSNKIVKKKTKKLSLHNKEVKRIADEKKLKGIPVKADIPGYPRPDVRGSVRPDVLTPKEVIEVETPKSMKKDKEQRRRLKISAVRRKQKFKVINFKR